MPPFSATVRSTGSIRGLASIRDTMLDRCCHQHQLPASLYFPEISKNVEGHMEPQWDSLDYLHSDILVRSIIFAVLYTSSPILLSEKWGPDRWAPLTCQHAKCHAKNFESTSSWEPHLPSGKQTASMFHILKRFLPCGICVACLHGRGYSSRRWEPCNWFPIPSLVWDHCFHRCYL